MDWNLDLTSLQFSQNPKPLMEFKFALLSPGLRWIFGRQVVRLGGGWKRLRIIHNGRL
jgi:hypothetical protein